MGTHQEILLYFVIFYIPIISLILSNQPTQQIDTEIESRCEKIETHNPTQ